MGRSQEVESSKRYTGGLSKNEYIGDFGQIEKGERTEQEFERIMPSKKIRGINDNNVYSEKDIPDVQQNLNALNKVVAETREIFEDLSRRLGPVLTPNLKSCDGIDKDSTIKQSEISPLGSELRAVTYMVRDLQNNILSISERIQL